MNFLYFAIIGIVAGWLAGQIMKGRGFGLVGNLVVGVLGAILGGWLFSALGISAGGMIGSLIMVYNLIRTCRGDIRHEEAAVPEARPATQPAE